MPVPNDPDTVADIMGRLGDGGAVCLLFGGWAEEALGLCEPRPHADIDLLLPARSFCGLDDLLRAGRDRLEEIPLKRFAHKRAFLFDGLLVEVLLVRQGPGTPYSLFWGDLRFEWSLPLSEAGLLGAHRMPCASRRNLRRYRAEYRSTEPWRWRNPTSRLVHPGPRSGRPGRGDEAC